VIVPRGGLSSRPCLEKLEWRDGLILRRASAARSCIDKANRAAAIDPAQHWYRFVTTAQSSCRFAAGGQIDHAVAHECRRASAATLEGYLMSG